MMARVAQFDTQMLRDGYTPTEAMVYGYLWWISWRNRKQWLWDIITPSIWLMKKTLCISGRSIIRAINKLEKTWLILVTRGYKTNNEYTVMDTYKYIPHSMPTPDNIS